MLRGMAFLRGGGIVGVNIGVVGVAVSSRLVKNWIGWTLAGVGAPCVGVPLWLGSVGVAGMDLVAVWGPSR